MSFLWKIDFLKNWNLEGSSGQHGLLCMHIYTHINIHMFLPWQYVFLDKLLCTGLFTSSFLVRGDKFKFTTPEPWNCVLSELWENEGKQKIQSSHKGRRGGDRGVVLYVYICMYDSLGCLLVVVIFLIFEFFENFRFFREASRSYNTMYICVHI
jgi:hypothetical protein